MVQYPISIDRWKINSPKLVCLPETNEIENSYIFKRKSETLKYGMVLT